ncbi:MAG: tyrosine--tRNA ligase, partial [Clostridia bacterium]|nr:tyrosine--tRNA ligase [Clostridia bacterium]
MMVKAGLAASKGEGRRLIQQGGVAVNGEKVGDPSTKISSEQLSDGLVIKKGKKVFHKFILK